MIDKIIEIEIYRQKYRIKVKGEEDEKYISHLTSYVDQKMREVAVKSKSVDSLKIAVLAALNIADEFFLSQKKLDQLNEVIGHMENEIEGLEVFLKKDSKAKVHPCQMPEKLIERILLRLSITIKLTPRIYNTRVNRGILWTKPLIF